MRVVRFYRHGGRRHEFLTHEIETRFKGAKEEIMSQKVCKREAPRKVKLPEASRSRMGIPKIGRGMAELSAVIAC